MLSRQWIVRSVHADKDFNLNSQKFLRKSYDNAKILRPIFTETSYDNLTVVLKVGNVRYKGLI